LDELNNAFRFNDAILRSLVVAKKEAVTEESFLAKGEDRRDERPSRETSFDDRADEEDDLEEDQE